MAENKQNSEVKNAATATEADKPTASGGAASPQTAKDIHTAANKAGSQGNQGSQSGQGNQSHQSNQGSQGSQGNQGNQGSQSASGDTAAVAKETLNTVKETAGAVTTQAVGQVKEKAGSMLEEQKTNLASGITSVADSIRQVGENLSQGDENNQIAALAGKYGDTLAGQVEKFSGYINDKEITELVRDVEQFARRNPLLFVGGALTLGILAARFLKSSGRNQKSAKHAKNRTAQGNS